jgi:hypothetical protein
MAKHSDLILVATVEEQRQFSPVAVASTLRVEKVVKGNAPTAPIVYEVGVLGQRGPMLENGTTCFLFLRKRPQKDNFFYVKGGHEGAFTKENGRLLGHEQFVRSIPLADGVDPFRALEHMVTNAK